MMMESFFEASLYMPMVVGTEKGRTLELSSNTSERELLLLYCCHRLIIIFHGRVTSGDENRRGRLSVINIWSVRGNSMEKDRQF
jgi:hypothetical protein